MKNIEQNRKKSKVRSRKRRKKFSDLNVYKEKMFAHKKQVAVRLAIILGVVAIGILGTTIMVQNHKYKSYKVAGKTEKLDASATKYVQMGNGVFRYGANGASLVGKDKSLLWEKSYEMQNPQVDICEGTLAVYSEKGNQIFVFNKLGLIGTLKTELPVLKVRVTKQGMIGVILEDDETTWINFYSTEGTLLASAKTRVDNPGYPVDFALSNDGKLIMVSYLFVDGDTTTSHVAFYNLDEAGKKTIDNIVSGYQYKGTIVPQVVYLDGSTSVAFRENGFSIYTGSQIPKEVATVKTEKEIISTFYDNDHIGLVFVSGKSDKKYTMEVYSTKGKRVFSEGFNIQYDTIKVSDNQIILHNDTQLSIFSMKGVEKFNGNIDEGKINDIFRTGYKEYMVILDNGISTITLK